MAVTGSGREGEAPLKDSLSTIWAKTLDAMPQKMDAKFIEQLNQQRVQLKRELFNKFVGLYGSDLEATPNLNRARGKKTDLALTLLNVLDQPITTLESAQKFSDSLTRMQPDTEGKVDAAFTTGRIAAPLADAQRKIEALDAKIEKKRRDENILNLFPDDFNDRLFALKYAVLYHDYAGRDLTQTEIQRGERPLEKSALNYLVTTADSILDSSVRKENYQTLERELIASEKLIALRDTLEGTPTGSHTSITLQITQRMLAIHCINQIRHALLKSFIEKQRKYEPDDARWLVDNIKSGEGAEKTLVDIFDHDFAPEFLRTAKTFPLNKNDLLLTEQSGLIEKCNVFLGWEKQISDCGKSPDNTRAQERKRAIQDVQLKMHEIIQSQTTQLVEDMDFLEKHITHPNDALQKIVIDGEKANTAIENRKYSTNRMSPSEREKSCRIKHRGYLASCLLDAKKMTAQLSAKQSVEEKLNRLQTPVPLSRHPAATFRSTSSKLEQKDERASHLRKNMQQMVQFYRARRGVNRGDHAAAANKFALFLAKSRSLIELKQELEKFWDSQVKRKGNEKSLIDLINRKEGHHMQRMVGMLLQDLEPGRFNPPILGYKRYHGDYHFELSNPLPKLKNAKAFTIQ
jgi:hypothetical protein